MAATAAAPAAKCRKFLRAGFIAPPFRKMTRGLRAARKTDSPFSECEPADGTSAANRKNREFGTSHQAARRLGYINHATRRKGESACGPQLALRDPTYLKRSSRRAHSRRANRASDS